MVSIFILIEAYRPFVHPPDVLGKPMLFVAAVGHMPESGLGKAIGYRLGLWRGLTCFLDDPRIPPDNNQTERGLRTVVLGRGNHDGSRSRRGLDAAALLYSLIESAKLSGVDPQTLFERGNARYAC